MTATTAKKMFLLIFVFDMVSGSFTVLRIAGLKESQLYYTTSFEKKQAGNAGNARESLACSTADFLPGACRQGKTN